MDFAKDFALNEYQTELSGRVQFFAAAFAICAGIFHYYHKNVFTDVTFTISMAANLVVTGWYFGLTYHHYCERFFQIVRGRAERLKKKITCRTAQLKGRAVEIKAAGRLWWIPNGLSIARMLSVIPFGFILYKEEFLFALVFFLISALTDLLDGVIARKSGNATKFGEILDPFADKTLYFGSLMALWLYLGNTQALNILIPTILPESLLVAIRFKPEWFIKRIIKPGAQATLVGKIKTFCFHFPTVVIILNGYVTGNKEYFQMGLFWGIGGAVFSLLSFLSHLKK